MNLITLLKRYKKGIIFAISLVVIEHIAWIIEPTVFGNAIDALIDAADSHTPFIYLTPLFVWISVFLLNSGVGAARRSIDPKIFLTIFTEVATEISRTGNKQNLSTSKIAARAELSREFITFFQYRIPEIIEQTIAIVGAVIALMFFDYRIALACLFIVLPLMVIMKLYNKKVSKIQKELHDTREEAFEIFSTREPEKVNAYYKRQSGSERKIANWGALNFGIMRFFLLGIFLVVLYISIDLDDFSTGNIYSIIAYLWTFVTSSEYLPELLESWTSLKDISHRLKTEEV
jgi:ABC-type multidrug transport system fused ATPase/permease subunit